MKKFLLAAFVMCSLIVPSFAFDLTAEYGTGLLDSIVVRTPVFGGLSINAGLDFKSVNTVIEVPEMKTNWTGTVYMPLVGIDYKIMDNSDVSVSIGSNFLFVIPVGNVDYSDEFSSDNGESAETAMNDAIKETIKNYSSMVFDVYARSNYAVSNNFNIFGTCGFKGLGATMDPEDSKTGLGLQTLYTKAGIAFDFSI